MAGVANFFYPINHLMVSENTQKVGNSSSCDRFYLPAVFINLPSQTKCNYRCTHLTTAFICLRINR